jgi:hypothetical protein
MGRQGGKSTQEERPAALPADGDGGILSIFADIFSAENVQSFSAKKNLGRARGTAQPPSA